MKNHHFASFWILLLKSMPFSSTVSKEEEREAIVVVNEMRDWWWKGSPLLFYSKTLPLIKLIALIHNLRVLFLNFYAKFWDLFFFFPFCFISLLIYFIFPFSPERDSRLVLGFELLLTLLGFLLPCVFFFFLVLLFVEFLLLLLSSPSSSVNFVSSLSCLKL